MGFFLAVEFTPNALNHDAGHLEVTDDRRTGLPSLQHGPCFGLLFGGQGQRTAKLHATLMGGNLSGN